LDNLFLQRKAPASINFLVVFGRTLEPSPNSSISSSVLGTKKGSESASQWQRTRSACQTPQRF